MEETGVLAGRGREEVGQTPLGPDQGIAIHHPDEDPPPADPDRLGDGLPGIAGKFEGMDQGDDVEFIVGEGEIFRRADAELGAAL